MSGEGVLLYAPIYLYMVYFMTVSEDILESLLGLDVFERWVYRGRLLVGESGGLR